MDDITFKHQALDNPAKSIRLIQIKSQPTASPLDLSLSTHSVANTLRYFAVSYTWGDGGFTEKLSINGCTMMVTKHCYYALTQINTRYPSDQNSQEPIYLWIDSICINQDDNDEKGHQVAMMGNIYTKATKVLACIGPHANNSLMLRSVLDDIKILEPQVYADREVIRSGHWSYNAAGIYLEWGMRSFLQSYPQDSTIAKEKFGIHFCNACIDFANRSYWSRVWIIQEFTATTRSGNGLEILCGCDSFSKSEINLCFSIAGYMFEQGKISDVHDKGLYLIFTDRHCFSTLMRFSALDPVPLGSILFYIGDLFHCLKSEDKVYGLLPLVTWPDDVAPIQPVYKPSSALDLAELLTSLTDAAPSKSDAILKALGIYHDHKFLRPLVEGRIQNPCQLSSRHGKYPLRASETIETCVLTVSKNDKGQLSAPLLLKSYDWIKGLNEEAEILQANKIFNGSQLLFTGSELAGLISSEAQEDDVIIQHETSSFLVLRPNNNIDGYDVVGQGVLFSKYKFPRDLPQSVGLCERNRRVLLAEYVADRTLDDDEQKRKSGKRNSKCLVQLRAEPIEWLLLVGQDLAKTFETEKERTFERLYTKINMEATIA